MPKTKAEYLECSQYLRTILDFYRWGLTLNAKKPIYLGHGCDDLASELVFLLLGSLELPLDWPQNFWEARLTEQECQFIAEQMYYRFEKKIPTAYLTHKTWFCGLEFYVDERVLIPRSPIAELIEQRFSPWIDAEVVTDILDLCTGSACIAAACAYYFPDALVDAVDIDEQALDVARLNIEHLGLAQQVRLLQSDGFQSLAEHRYDIIVSNPPYVGEIEMQSLPREYAYEPRHALAAADHGLYLVHHILQTAKQYLKPEGILVVELGNSDEALVEAYPQLPFIWLEFERGGHGVFLLTAKDLP